MKTQMISRPLAVYRVYRLRGSAGEGKTGVSSGGVVPVAVASVEHYTAVLVQLRVGCVVVIVALSVGILVVVVVVVFCWSPSRGGHIHAHGRRVRDMNRGPTVAQPLPVDRYAGNCLIKPSYYCGGGGTVGGVHCNNAALEQSPSARCRYDAAAAAGYRHHVSPPTPYQHYQQFQDWYGRTAYWHHHQGGGGGGGGGPLAEKANFAAHKHGAPLIQAAKYNRVMGAAGGPGKKYGKKTPAEQPNNGCGTKKNDGGSDESSGTASENSLPRIIKPRKRRKKERKPVPVVQQSAVKPLIIAAAVVAVPERRDDRSSSSSSSSSSPPPPPQQLQTLVQQLQDAAPFDTIRLSADIKAVSLEDVSTCQCACCDPVGNVWDVGRRCFSPSLTRPEPARRSWSGGGGEPSFSKTAAVALAAYRAQPEIVDPAVRVRTRSLEVSSEIVTSHNGHRDIEIKFFTMPVDGDR